MNFSPLLQYSSFLIFCLAFLSSIADQHYTAKYCLRYLYCSIAETMGKLPVIVRTLDVGGDKPLPYIEMQKEENPFLGERGIRLCLNRPELFRMQLRAIMRAGLHGNLQIMFPMVADIEEYRRARLMLDELQIELNIPHVVAGILM